MMLTDLDRTLRDAGLSVVELNGWKTRGRPGGMEGVKTITCHHTANGGASGNSPSLTVVRDGRPGLPGPLSQVFLARDGTWYVVAAGKSNHAGESQENRFTNPWAVGIEAEAVGVPGTAGDWPDVQMRSYARGVAALIKRYGLNAADVRGHKETCAPVGRKSDPSFDMSSFRRRVLAVDLDQEVPHVIDAADVNKIAKAVGALPIPNKTPGQPDAAPSSIAGSIVDIERTQDGQVKAAAVQHAAVMSALAGLTTAVRELVARLPVQ